MGKERKTDRRYAAADNDGEPNLSDQEIAQLRAQAQSRRNAPIRKLPDGRKVLDLGLARLYDDVPSVSTAYELPSTNGERHIKGSIESILTFDKP